MFSFVKKIKANVPDPHPRKGLCKIQLIADLNITILGVFMKKFRPLILKKTSGKYSPSLYYYWQNVNIKIKIIIIAENIKINLIPRKTINVEIIPSNAFLEFVQMIKYIIKKLIVNSGKILILHFKFFLRKQKANGKLTDSQKPA